jgi:hypothetical protein
VCGGGLVGAIFWAASQADKAANSIDMNKGTSPTPGPNRSPGSTTSSDRTSVDKLDLNKWVQENSLYGNNEFEDDQLIMSSKKRKFYYALAGTSSQVTVGADSRVSVKNMDNEDTNLGYGLVFHSNTTPLQQGYAFLLDSKNGRPRWREKLWIIANAPGLQALAVHRFGAWINVELAGQRVRYPLKAVYYALDKITAIMWGIHIDEGADIRGGLYIPHVDGVLIGAARLGSA